MRYNRLLLFYATRFILFCLLCWTIKWLITAPPHSYAQGTPIGDPIPGPIAGGLSVRLVPWVTVPASSSAVPKARISFTTHANDGSGRLFVNDMRGKLYVIKNNQVSVYLDLKNEFADFFVDTPGLGTGFAFFAFAPNFAQTGKFYTIHSEAGNAHPLDYAPQGTVLFHAVLVEWTTPNPASDTFAGDPPREVLRVGFPSNFHNFQQIAFNPTANPGDADYGLLYLSMGDGEEQTAATWTDVAQNLARPYGKILRIDPNARTSPNGQYGIPADNPFVGQTPRLGEIWVYGFRNPHRFSWDSGGTHKMILTNIGEKQIEEIELGIKGANYGWNEREGEFLFDTNDPNKNIYPLPVNDASFGYTYPVAMYDHDEGRSVVGGFVYRGAAMPELQGKYIFGDIVNGRLFYIEESAITVAATAPGNNANLSELKLVDANGTTVTLLGLLAPSTRVDLRFGIDAAGELLISSKQNGQIWRLASLTGNATSTPTVTSTASGTSTSTSTPTNTPTATATSTSSGTPPSTATPTSTTSGTPSPTASATNTGTITPQATAEVTAQATAEATLSPTLTQTPDPLATATITFTPMPTSTVVASSLYQQYLPYLQR